MVNLWLETWPYTVDAISGVIAFSGGKQTRRGFIDLFFSQSLQLIKTMSHMSHKFIEA